jgi:hypothetical protein
MISGVVDFSSVRRRVLDQLVERRALHHLARRGRQIAAQLERVGIAVWVSWPLAMSAIMWLRPFNRLSPFVSIDLLDHFGIGRGEVARAHRIDEAAWWRSASAPSAADRGRPCASTPLQQVVGDHQIALAQEVEHRLLAPLRRLEALVARLLRRVSSNGCGVLRVEEALPQASSCPPRNRWSRGSPRSDRTSRGMRTPTAAASARSASNPCSSIICCARPSTQVQCCSSSRSGIAGSCVSAMQHPLGKRRALALTSRALVIPGIRQEWRRRPHGTRSCRAPTPERPRKCPKTSTASSVCPPMSSPK